jgi:hypothetical protein
LCRPDHRPVRRPVELAAAEDGADAADELGHRERLRHVVIGAGLEPDHTVDLGIAGGQHENRNVAAGPGAAADLDPGEARQHQVEHDEVGLVRRLDRA